MDNFEWAISGSDAGMYVGAAIAGAIKPAAEKDYSDLVDFLPFMNVRICNVFFKDDWWAVIAESRRSGVHVCGYIEGEYLEAILELGNRPYDNDFYELQKLILGAKENPKKYIYIGRYKNGKADWPHFHGVLFRWLNEIVMPVVLEANNARVARAIPPSPEFDIEHIQKGSIVLECEKEINQGSAFALENFGFITCEHVLGSQTEAFQADHPNRRFPVRVIKRNSALDIALLEIDGLEINPIARGDPSKLEVLSPIAVYGFPNYRLGDTGAFMPGNVVGYRNVSTVTRILTNSTIVEGSSGGVCIDESNSAIGIAVTGARSFATGSDTENHGIVPIDALDILLSQS